MKINEIIRERRLSKQLTQEQMANYLGVTAPAVNKWEKGSSYPDITLLPALARLLDTDLNTLLSFKEELTETEIALFVNYLSKTIDTDGFEKAYDIAMEKIKEYPNCYLLILNVALFLDGSVMLNNKKSVEDYQTAIEALYERVSCSTDNNSRNQAQSVLISKYMARKDYDKAQELLKTLPEKSPVDKKQLQVNLLMAYGKFEQAGKIEEEKLLSSANEIQTILMALMEIALKEKRMEDAEYIADVSQKSAKLFDLWEYNFYTAYFQLYSICKNRVKCLKVLIPMLKALTHKWDINSSPLYRHIKTKEIEKGFGTKMRKAIIQSMCEDDAMEFLQGSKEYQNIIKDINKESDDES
ncbi:MAG: helix-turn-helix domain-containing protein [Candidatus Fimimorpha sp.]